MDSERLRKLKSVRWADLPSELLATISGSLQNPSHIIRFRSVCRSWRFSTSPPPNILSLLLPLKFFLSPERFSGRCPRFLTFTTNAVYLLRTPSKAWMVSVQEFVAGNLVLRHALTREEISICPSGRNSLELSPEHWSSANQIARWYSQYIICEKCGEIARADKVVFVSEDSMHNCANPSPQLVGLCNLYDGSTLPYAIRLGRDPCTITQLVSNALCSVIDDFVEFHGRIYAVDTKGDFYVFDHKTSQLLLVINYPYPEHRYSAGRRFGDKRLVVSDGDLYMVFRYYSSMNEPLSWVIYRLVSMDHDSNVVTITRGRCKWEKVKNLGDKVLFINMKYCSFSVSARDLPPPWIGNCVVFVDVPDYPCACFPKRKPVIEVYHLGHGRGRRQQPRRLSPPVDGMPSVQGYFDLFDPPSSWIDQ